MKKTLFYVIVFFSVVGVSCSEKNTEAENTVVSQDVIAKDVDAAEFKELLESKNGVLLDVRTPEECAGGMIEGAKNVDYLSGDFENSVSDLDKNEPIFVYCAAGGRSANAMNDLTNLGFKEVYNLLGGYNGWK